MSEQPMSTTVHYSKLGGACLCGCDIPVPTRPRIFGVFWSSHIALVDCVVCLRLLKEYAAAKVSANG